MENNFIKSIKNETNSKKILSIRLNNLSLNNNGVIAYNVSKINSNTERAKTMINNYRRSANVNSIYDIYDNCSSEKYRAFEWCRNFCMDIKGVNLRCTGHSCHQFSMGFEMNYNNKNYLIYITALNNYIIEL